MEHAFECPQCGGYKFGTRNCTSNYDEWVGVCRGNDEQGGCGFTWHRAVDDEKLLGRPLMRLGEKPAERARQPQSTAT